MKHLLWSVVPNFLSKVCRSIPSDCNSFLILTVKFEILEEATKNNEVSIEELDQDFESMLQSIENQVESEVVDQVNNILEEETEEFDTKADLELDIGKTRGKTK